MNNAKDSKAPGRFRSTEEWEEYKNRLIAEAQAIKEKPKIADKKNPASITAPTEKKCRYCAMMIPKEAKVCPHCRKTFGLSGAAKIFLTIFIIGILAAIITPRAKHTSPPPPENNSQKPQVEPYSFKDFQLGMTLGAFNDLNPDVTYKNDDKRFEATRFVNTTIGGSKGKAFFLFGDYGKGLQLSYISITIPKIDFPAVKIALISKYGPPKNAFDISKSNAMGAKFEGERLVWNNGISEISSESIGSKIDEADIVFSHLKLGRSKQDQENSEKAKKDI